jgi:solute carrier family 25 (mitochondrial uncoupling protein), member 8/9
MQIARRIVAEEGAGAFFRGWMANYARLGPQTLLIFVVAEQLRKMMGLSSL